MSTRNTALATQYPLSSAVLMTMVGCGVLPFVDEKDGGSESKAMQVVVEVASDAETVAGVSAGIDSRDDPQHIEETEVSMAYKDHFEVPLNTLFPLSGVTVEATSASTTKWISCRVVLDGDVIAEDRLSGADQTVMCAKKLRLGPQ